MKRYLFVSLLLIPFFQLFGQLHHDGVNAYIERIVEHALSNSQDQVPVESLIEDLEYFYQHPIDLNQVSQEELEKLWILNDFQIKALLNYRRTMFQIISVYEIQYVYGFNQTTFELILPFVKVESRAEYENIAIKKLKRRLNSQYLAQLNYKSPSQAQYNGNPVGMYSKLTFDYQNQLKFGILAENDAGEYFFKKNNACGFDFYSGHFQIKTNSFIKSITLGDYKVHAGQGLLIWNGFSTGKSTEVLSTMKSRQGITVSRSKNEYNFLRGAGLQISVRDFGLYLYGSLKKTDAVLDTVDGTIRIQSLSTTGYHRTTTEYLRKYNSDEKNFGAMLYFQDDRTRIGINWLAVQYNYPFYNDSTGIKPGFQGKYYLGCSMDYKVLLNNYHFFGELAYHDNSIAAISGMNILISSNFNASFLYRNYSINYYSPYSNSFGENSKNANENGLFAGFQWQPDKQIEVSAFTDVFSFPWYTYSANKPSSGTDNLIEIKFIPSSYINLKLMYRYKGKKKNFTNDLQPTHQIETFTRQNIRINLSTKLSDNLLINSRFEVCKAGFSNQHNPKGYLAYQDIIFQINKKTKLNFRYAFFNNTDYNTRIYAYEHDVLYDFSVPAYYGNGQKTYILIQRKMGETITLWLKYCFTQLFDEPTICKQLFKTQVRLKF